METKSAIRKEVYARRKAACPDEIRENSRRIRERVTRLPEFSQAEWIYVYIDCKNEVMTGEIIREALAQGKKVAAPRVEGREMRFYRITSREDLEPGYFGIREPRQGLPEAEAGQTLMIMPGVAFDRQRRRIGYGGGFYDRYLAGHPGIRTAALAFEFQMFSQVPWEETDILPDRVITEKEIY